MRSVSVVDLFCGVGGMTHGFVKEGFKVIAGIDADPTCEYAYEKNNGAEFIEGNIEYITPEEIKELYPEAHLKILIGCAPCQPFSQYTNPKSKDEKWKLLHSFADLIKGVRPEVVSMENVPQLERHEVFDGFVKTLREEGYTVSYSLVHGPHYGIPQTRTRLVLFASKFGEVELVKRTHYPCRERTVGHTIKGLERIKAGEWSEKDPLHYASKLSPLNLRRITCTPTGGTWKDWPDHLVLDCHKEKTGETYRGVYGRMKWDRPGPTMTTQCFGLGNGRFGHPEQNRAISLREAALLQTFPKGYKFIDPKVGVVVKVLGRHIGNAVPVRLGRIIARSIKKHLEAHLG